MYLEPGRLEPPDGFHGVVAERRSWPWGEGPRLDVTIGGMSSSSYVQFANQGILTLEDQRLVGLGRITPRLSFQFKASTSIQPGLTGRLLSLQLQVTFNSELLGTGCLPPQFHIVSQQRSPLPALDVALSPAALTFLRDGVRADDLVLGLKFSGLFQADTTGCPPWIQQQSPSLLRPSRPRRRRAGSSSTGVRRSWTRMRQQAGCPNP